MTIYDNDILSSKLPFPLLVGTFESMIFQFSRLVDILLGGSSQLVSGYLTPIYKPFRPLGMGTTLIRRLIFSMVIYHSKASLFLEGDVCLCMHHHATGQVCSFWRQHMSHPSRVSGLSGHNRSEAGVDQVSVPEPGFTKVFRSFQHVFFWFKRWIFKELWLIYCTTMDDWWSFGLENGNFVLGSDQ